MQTNHFDKIYAITVASGKGSRMGIDMPKQLLPYGGSTVLETSMEKFLCFEGVDALILTSPSDGSLDELYGEIAERLSAKRAKKVRVVRGGKERGDSVQAGLSEALALATEEGADAEKTLVLIHDAARPGVSEDIISECIEAMRRCRAVTVAMPSVDSVRIIPDFTLNQTPTYPIITSADVSRDRVFAVQTPQAFKLSDILAAYEHADRTGFVGTDDASVAENFGIEVAIVKGDAANKKITTKEDIHMATRVGTGYDVHRLVPGRDLILCGTPIPSKLGLDGHSDADAATHALMDALLGAAGMGDIGQHFPDSDDKYKGANSMELLAEVKKMLGEAKVGNVDITIIAEQPKLAPYKDKMKENIATVLGIPITAVNVKATTEEGLGFTGKGEGIAAWAACTIEGSF